MAKVDTSEQLLPPSLADSLDPPDLPSPLGPLDHQSNIKIPGEYPENISRTSWEVSSTNSSWLVGQSLLIKVVWCVALTANESQEEA